MGIGLQKGSHYGLHEVPRRDVESGSSTVQGMYSSMEGFVEALGFYGLLVCEQGFMGV